MLKKMHTMWHKSFSLLDLRSELAHVWHCFFKWWFRIAIILERLKKCTSHAPLLVMGLDWFSFAKWYFCTDLYIGKPACCYMPDDKSSMVNLLQCIMWCGYELCLWERNLKLTVTLSIQESTAYHTILGFSLENLLLDQLKIPKLICFLILVTFLLDIVFDIVRRNSFLVAPGS